MFNSSFKGVSDDPKGEGRHSCLKLSPLSPLETKPSYFTGAASKSKSSLNSSDLAGVAGATVSGFLTS